MVDERTRASERANERERLSVASGRDGQTDSPAVGGGGRRARPGRERRKATEDNERENEWKLIVEIR